MSEMKVFKQTFKYGDIDVTLETGRIARQATGSVLVTMKDTVVLVTAVVKNEAREGADFFPMTINYQEKMYSAGKIPGGFLRREGRPGDHETLIARLIDRPLRPLFPEGFHNEVQVVATVMSLDPEVQPDIPAMIGASAALALSGAPFMGPIGGVRVGYQDGKYLMNPSREVCKNSQLDLVVAGTQDAVLMVESEADCLPEDVMLGAVMFGHEQMQVAIKAINDLTKAAGKPKMVWAPQEADKALVKKVSDAALAGIKEAYGIQEKAARYAKVGEVKAATVAAICTEESGLDEKTISTIFGDLEKNHVRQNIINGELRIDGRDTRTVRPIRIENRVLPRTHGSALFTRGETQAIVVATLGNERDAQILDQIHGEAKDRFMLHYNFPPYCVGETGMMGSPKRREIGHGNLARRAVSAVLPTAEAFPYTMRVVSEITESNGSSSMASVCGSSLALMDAGVPLKAPVAGVAMGLIKEGEKFAVLTDILGDEDHLGDMDFKVAGTQHGVTALQMDIKITGITKAIMEVALSQALEARLHILGLMNKVISKPNTMSDHAPRIHTMKVKPEKVREIIGKGGSTIKGITDATGVSIDLDDDGNVQIFAADNNAAKKAMEMIEGIIADVEIGMTYEGKVVRVEEYGAFVNFLGTKQGLVHISQIQDAPVDKVTDHLKLEDIVQVKVLDIDRQGRVKLTMKGLDVSSIDTSAEKKPAKSQDESTESTETSEETSEETAEKSEKKPARKPRGRTPRKKADKAE